jgi:phosphopantothenoylcysteine decarboxylase/phosphopantothenate--cysteine ligase
MLNGKHILLVISGGIAAYKSLDLIRRLRERGTGVRCILTGGGARFITPLSVASLSGEKVHTDLFSLTDELEMGHIRLAREPDLIVVAPASANLLAKLAAGLADTLAGAVLLATDRPVLIAPAMNEKMWAHPATQANVARLEARGIKRIGPMAGDLACGEHGKGRLAEPLEIVAAIEDHFRNDAPLSGRRALVTSGPTWESLDPVRYLANRSSGKQGHAIATALARLGAETVLVTGPTHEPDPAGARVVHIESAREMLAACEAELPVDVAVLAAAVADWRAARPAARKIKKSGAPEPPRLDLEANPDILKRICKAGNRRPRLVIGFAAETEQVVENAQAKRQAKGCDWICANDVSREAGVFGGETNTVHLIRENEIESWPTLSKQEVAGALAERIARCLADPCPPPLSS